MPKSPAPEPDKAPSFEQRLDELDAVVKQLETSELPLEKAIELFERGVKLSESCRKELLEAEMRVEILLKKGTEVQPEPFEPEEE